MPTKSHFLAHLQEESPWVDFSRRKHDSLALFEFEPFPGSSVGRAGDC